MVDRRVGKIENPRQHGTRAGNAHAVAAIDAADIAVQLEHVFNAHARPSEDRLGDRIAAEVGSDRQPRVAGPLDAFSDADIGVGRMVMVSLARAHVDPEQVELAKAQMQQRHQCSVGHRRTR